MPSGVAIPKSIYIPIVGGGCFTIRIDNPTPYDITASQTINWLQTAPPDVQTTLSGPVTVLAGQSKFVSSPCFDAGWEAEQDQYSLDIIWTGTDEMNNSIQFITDPEIRLYWGGTGGQGVGGNPDCVGGIALPVDKLDLLAPWIGLMLLLVTVVVSVVIRKKRSA